MKKTNHIVLISIFFSIIITLIDCDTNLPIYEMAMGKSRAKEIKADKI